MKTSGFEYDVVTPLTPNEVTRLLTVDLHVQPATVARVDSRTVRLQLRTLADARRVARYFNPDQPGVAQLDISMHQVNDDHVR